MKKLISFFLVLCILAGFAGCSTAETPATTQATKATEAPVEQASSISPLLYQVTDESGNTIWLFGSIHVGREDFYPLPTYITNAFNQAEALAVEFDIRAYEKDMAAQAQDMLNYTYLDGTTIEDHIDPALYADASALLQGTALPAELLNLYKPMFWASLIESMAYETETTSATLGIDYHMIDAAIERNIPVLSIESSDFQSKMLGGFSEEFQELYLRYTVDNADTATQDILDLLNLWASGDEEAFCAYLNTTEGAPEEAAIYEEYNKAMITDRNLNMTDFAEAQLKDGTATMICVGAAHIVGDGAMAQLLAERGYTVTRILPE